LSIITEIQSYSNSVIL